MNLFVPGRHPRPFPRPRRIRGYRYATAQSVFAYPYPSNESGYIDIRAENMGGDHNEVWKYVSGGTAVRITDSMPIGGTYRDYAVASGTAYFYFIRAVNADGSYLQSATSSAVSTFTGFWMHAVSKDDSTNALSVPVSLNAIPPQQRPISRETEFQSAPSRTRMIAATGEATVRQWSVQIYSTLRATTDAVTLEDFAALKQTLCVRDGGGRLMFGTMEMVPINYGVTPVIQLNLTETDYRESIV